jgi:hypothetical protein
MGSLAYEQGPSHIAFSNCQSLDNSPAIDSLVSKPALREEMNEI